MRDIDTAGIDQLSTAMQAVGGAIRRMTEAFGEAVAQAGQAFAGLGAQWRALRAERPVDRARRLHVARMMRLRGRRAHRHQRLLA